MNKIIEDLKDDSKYYGKLGSKYLSNSDIGTLLKDPAKFKVPTEPTSAMRLGSYFHTLCLEPKKVSEFEIVDCSSRNTKLYKEAAAESQSILLLSKEVEMIDNMVEALRGNMDLFDLVWGQEGVNEQPGIKTIMGNQWKAKADRVIDDYVIDLKTTGDLDGFMWSARKFNYDSQAWLYNQIFGKPMLFIAIEKNTNRLGMFECSNDFLEYGKQKVKQATLVFNNFFGTNAIDSIDQYYLKSKL